MLRTLLNVIALLSSLSLTACALDVSLFSSVAKLPSSSQVTSGPATYIPTGNYSLTLTKTLGKNKWVGAWAQGTGNGKGLLDNTKNFTMLGDGGIITFDASGAAINTIPMDFTTYQRWVAGPNPFFKSPSGDYYIGSSINWSQPVANGILKVTAAGAISQLPLTAGHQLQNGVWDLKPIKFADNSDGMMSANFNTGATVYGSVDPTTIDLYDLNGNYLRSIGAAENTTLKIFSQNPVTKDIWALSNNYPNYIYQYHIDGTLVHIHDFTGGAVESFIDVTFDASGKMYVTGMGDPNDYANGGTTRGIAIYDVSSGTPSLVSAIHSNSSRTLRVSYLAISPDGQTFVVMNNAYRATGLAERWEYSSGAFQYITSLDSSGSGVNDFNSTSGVGVMALDSSENVYIDDNGNKRVKVYTKDGTFLRSFSVDDTNINYWAIHSLATTSTGKIVASGYNYDLGNTTQATIILKKYSPTGVLEDTKSLFMPAVAMIPQFMGIDSQDRMWYDDGATLYAVTLDGTLDTTLSRSDASFNVTGAVYGPQIIGTKIYYLDIADYSLHVRDLDGTHQVISSAAQNAAAGLILIYPGGGIQPLRDGKLACLAVTTSMTGQYLVLEPANNYSIVSKITINDINAFGLMIWTSAGLFVRGTYDRFMLYSLQ